MNFTTKYLFSFLFLGFLIVYPNFLNAQNFADKRYYLIDSLLLEEVSVKDKKLIDSVLILYYQAKHDTLKIKAIDIIIAECWNDKIWPKYNDWVFRFTEEKLKIYGSDITNEESVSVRKSILISYGNAIGNKGYLKNTQGDIIEALAYYTKSLKISEQVNDEPGIATMLNNIGGIYKNQGKIPEALEFYDRSLKVNKRIGDKLGMANTINNMGIIYSYQKNKEKALESFLESMRLQEEINDRAGVAASLNNIGHIKESQGENEKALVCYQKSLKIREELGDKYGMAVSLNKIGKLFEVQNDIKTAMTYYAKSLKLSKRIGYKEGMTHSLYNIGSVHIKQEDILKAKKYAKENMEISIKMGYPTQIKDAAELLNIIYKKENKWQEAYKMRELFVVMRDSLLNIEAKEAIIRQQANHEIENKEQEIKLLASENTVLIQNEETKDLKLNRRKILIILFSTAFIFAFILAIGLYRGYKKKQVINELLEKQKDEVSRKNEEKKAMLKEIHHRVKNNLQVVNSLLKLQSRGIEDKHVVAMFKEAQNRVLSMALLHEKMYRADDLKHIDVKEHFMLLVNDLVSSYAVEKNITLDVDVEELDIGMRTLVPLGLIINEIITNSLKYAFENNNEGKIIVHIKHLKGKEYEMILGDNGIGLIEKEETTGIGKKLIQIFVKQLNGEMLRLDKSGTIYKIIFEKID